MKRYQNLIVWQKAHELVLDIYRITEYFPVEERAALSSQMRRTAMLIPATIVEGYSSGKIQDFISAMMNAENSLTRLHYYIELSRELGYLFHEPMALLLENMEAIGQLLRGVHIHVNKESNHEYASSR